MLRAIIKEIVNAAEASVMENSVEMVTNDRGRARWAYVTMCYILEIGANR
jgi:hypothetical protein